VCDQSDPDKAHPASLTIDATDRNIIQTKEILPFKEKETKAKIVVREDTQTYIIWLYVRFIEWKRGGGETPG
jgi:hypothetical protein